MQHALRHIVLLPGIALLLGAEAFAAPDVAKREAAARDSLAKVYACSDDVRVRLRACVDLADLHSGDNDRELIWWHRAVSEAHRTGDRYFLKTALDYLILKTAWKEPERAMHYADTARLLLPAPEDALFVAYLNAYTLYTRIQTDRTGTVVSEELQRFKKLGPERLSVRQQVEWEFLTGVVLDSSSAASGVLSDIPQGIPHIEKAISLLHRFPAEERLHFERLCRQELSDLYMMTDDPRAGREIERMLALHRLWIGMNVSFPRPWFDDTFVPMFVCSKMLFIGNLIPRSDLDRYYAEYLRLAARRRHYDPRDTYRVSARYYQFTGDYPRSIRYMDSLIEATVARKEDLPLYPIYLTQSNLYEQLGDYRNALRTLQTADKLREGTNAERNREALAEIQGLYELNSLQLEKVRMADRNKRVALMGAALLVLLLAGWMIYERIMRRRLHRMYRTLLAANREIERQSRKAAESERMKTEFLNTMCHEIRTPLNAIAGFSELMLDPAIERDAKVEFNALIRSNTGELTRLVDNMLELSDLASSDAALPTELTDLAALCRREAEAVAPRMAEAGIDLHTECGGVCETATHPFYLARVIAHLLDNALKFTPRGGRVTLACRCDGTATVLSVTDTGAGIPVEKREWVFGRFAKLDPFKSGTGIGLYSCRLIVSRLGGTIRFDDTYREGCRFVVELPI